MLDRIITSSAHMARTFEAKNSPESRSSNVNIKSLCVIANGFHDEA
jgi:hypothetical protein